MKLTVTIATLLYLNTPLLATGLSSPRVSPSTSTAAPGSQTATGFEPYGTAEINYSAANEYLDEQYEQQIPNPYFPGMSSKEEKKKSY
jgi:hypothetical protein